MTDQESAEGLKRPITEILDLVPTNEYFLTFEKYLEWMQLCVNNKGEYFQRFMKENKEFILIFYLFLSYNITY
jgi:hypothetical protein